LPQLAWYPDWRGKIDNQEILQNNEQDAPSSSAILRWLIVIIILGLLFGSAYWYYYRYIVKPAPAPSPSPEATEAVWKTKSEKTTNDFLNYWFNSAKIGENEAQKARDLLTIAAQAKLETIKDPSGENYSSLSDKLIAFIGLESIPQSYQIITTKKIDERTVEVSVKFMYDKEPSTRIFTVVLEGNIWLIDSVQKESVLSPTISPSLSPSPSPAAIPSENL